MIIEWHFKINKFSWFFHDCVQPGRSLVQRRAHMETLITHTHHYPPRIAPRITPRTHGDIALPTVWATLTMHLLRGVQVRKLCAWLLSKECTLFTFSWVFIWSPSRPTQHWSWLRLLTQCIDPPHIQRWPVNTKCYDSANVLYPS